MIRIGIVGCGRILAAHLRGFRLLREAGDADFLVTAICARRIDDARMYVERGKGPPQRKPCSNLAGDPLSIGDEYLSDFQDPEGVEVYDDYRTMIQKAPIDAVIDLTTHAMHHRIAIEAFHQGKHVLSQKPLAATIRAARAMCQAADESGCVFAVFECFRYLPATRALEWFFHRGPGGKLQMILLGYVGAWWAPNRVVANTPWRHSRTEGGGITLDLGVHFFDQMRYVAGEPVWVMGHACVVESTRVLDACSGKTGPIVECDADDTVFANIAFAGGTVANWSASWAGHAGPTLAGRGTVFYGTNSRVDGDWAQVDGREPEDVVALYEREAETRERARSFPRGLRDWFALGQLDWLEAIRTGRRPETAGRDGLVDLAASYAILESSALGRRVHVEEVLSGELREYQKPIDLALGLG